VGGVWNLLTLEQLQQLSDEQITRRVNDLLSPNGGIGNPFMAQPADFIAAQFYVSELDRRENRRANAERDRIETKRRRVDLGLELLIVAIIGLELILAIWGAHQQSKDAAQELKALADMEGVLSNLQQTSQATANTMTTLEKTTETMNGAIQNQLALSYDPSVLVKYTPTHQLDVLNNGGTNITLWGSKLGDQAPVFLKVPSVLPRNAGYEFDAEAMYNQFFERFQKEGSVSVPYEIYVKNDLGRKYLVDCTLTSVTGSYGVTIVTQVNGIIPREWGKK